MSRAAAQFVAEVPPPAPAGDLAGPARAERPAREAVRQLGLANPASLQRGEAEAARPRPWTRHLTLLPSWLVSMIVHLLLLIGLALWSQPNGHGGESPVLLLSESSPGVDTAEAVSLTSVQLGPIGQSDAVDVDHLHDAPAKFNVYAALDGGASEKQSDSMAERVPSLLDPEILHSGEFPSGGGLGGRNPDARAKAAAERGGTPATEAAVERGLRWLVAHQRADGSWRFDHHEQCDCRNAGSEASTTAATAIALLPFLGAGYTHQRESEYKDAIERGVYYLGSRMLVTPGGGDLQEGTMYAQGLATIALCEAYAMTDDQTLKPYAQSAIKFVQWAQDKKGGGWRYTPGAPGDTTVFGWQLMALKSGSMANLEVRSLGFMLAEKFLDSVQTDGGAGYGYQTPKREPTTTAVGLLCRMYTGWRRDRDALARGVKYLDELGPSKDNMYYNYYATQVMHHYDGPMWYRWNERMREHLITTQAQRGHESGSWYFSGGHAETGGRLYNTAMAVMTLEVYYRYMPLYQSEAAEGF